MLGGHIRLRSRILIYGQIYGVGIPCPSSLDPVFERISQRV